MGNDRTEGATPSATPGATPATTSDPPERDAGGNDTEHEVSPALAKALKAERQTRKEAERQLAELQQKAQEMETQLREHSIRNARQSAVQSVLSGLKEKGQTVEPWRVEKLATTLNNPETMATELAGLADVLKGVEVKRSVPERFFRGQPEEPSEPSLLELPPTLETMKRLFERGGKPLVESYRREQRQKK